MNTIKSSLILLLSPFFRSGYPGSGYLGSGYPGLGTLGLGTPGLGTPDLGTPGLGTRVHWTLRPVKGNHPLTGLVTQWLRRLTNDPPSCYLY